MSKELDKYLEKYVKTFEEGFPMYQIGRGRTEKEIIDIIKECCKTMKDAYELGYVTDDDNVEY